MSQATLTPPRSEIPVERTWDAASVFETPEAWAEALEALVGDLAKLEAFAGRLESNAAR